VALFDSFSLAALHVIASITGSLVLALALADGESTPAHIFRLSRIDEDYQAEKWGVDSQGEIRARALAHELDKAAEFITHART
jgi:chaperone required for assembly of F1-ATPase